MDSRELKFRFVVEYLGTKLPLPRRFRWDEDEDEEEVRSRVMVGYEGEDEIDGFGR